MQTLKLDTATMQASFTSSPGRWFEVVDIERFKATIWIRTGLYVTGYHFTRMHYVSGTLWQFDYDNEIRQIPIDQQRSTLDAQWDHLLRSGHNQSGWALV